MKDGTKLVYELRRKIDITLLKTCIVYDGDWVFWEDYDKANKN